MELHRPAPSPCFNNKIHWHRSLTHMNLCVPVAGDGVADLGTLQQQQRRRHRRRRRKTKGTNVRNTRPTTTTERHNSQHHNIYTGNKTDDERAATKRTTRRRRLFEENSHHHNLTRATETTTNNRQHQTRQATPKAWTHTLDLKSTKEAKVLHPLDVLFRVLGVAESEMIVCQGSDNKAEA